MVGKYAWLYASAQNRVILRRFEGSRFSEILPGWAGRTAVLLGGGPSLTLEQVEKVSRVHQEGRCRAIAINDAYLVAPWCDLCYFADSGWHEWQTKGIAKPLLKLTAEQVRERFAAFAGQKCSIQNSGDNIKDPAVHILRNATFPIHGLGLSADTGALITGRHSGFQALNLAILAGAKKVILLGFDGRPGVDGKNHWFGEHPVPTQTAVWEQMRKAMSAAEGSILAAGVRVINCSPSSAIDSFPKMALEEALK